MRILLILERTILFNRIPKNYQFLLSITEHILYFFNIVFLKTSRIEIDKEIKVHAVISREKILRNQIDSSQRDQSFRHTWNRYRENRRSDRYAVCRRNSIFSSLLKRRENNSSGRLKRANVRRTHPYYYSARLSCKASRPRLIPLIYSSKLITD